LQTGSAWAPTQFKQLVPTTRLSVVTREKISLVCLPTFHEFTCAAHHWVRQTRLDCSSCTQEAIPCSVQIKEWATAAATSCLRTAQLDHIIFHRRAHCLANSEAFLSTRSLVVPGRISASRLRHGASLWTRTLARSQRSRLLVSQQ
jgi:hypothetical protein